VLEDVWKEYAGPFAHGTHEINNALSELKSIISDGPSGREITVLETLSDAVTDAKRALSVVEKKWDDARTIVFNDLPKGDELKKTLQRQDWIRTSTGRELRLKDLSLTATEINEILQICLEIPTIEIAKTAAFLCEAVVKKKLLAHKDKKVVKDYLTHEKTEDMMKYLLTLKGPTLEEFANLLKAVLTGLKFISLNLSDFKPTHTTLWGEVELMKTVEEFRDFLKENAKDKVVKLE
jgi:preprotein translocase subunit Sss1